MTSMVDMSPLVEISFKKFHILERLWFHTNFVAANVWRYARAHNYTIHTHTHTYTQSNIQFRDVKQGSSGSVLCADITSHNNLRKRIRHPQH